MSKHIIELLLINIRSAHNVGAIFRSADALGVSNIICSGHTPYPQTHPDPRLPHIASGAQAKIAKTALGAELSVPFIYAPQAQSVIKTKKAAGYQIIALELVPKATPLPKFKPQFPCLLILGEETRGLSAATLKLADHIVAIPMSGSKESLNVASAAAIALYHLRFS